MQPPEVAEFMNRSNSQQQQFLEQRQLQQQQQQQQNAQQIAAAAAIQNASSMSQIALANAARAMSVAQTPLGLRALVDACLRIYPGQVNPLQVSTLVKFWFVFLFASSFLHSEAFFFIKLGLVAQIH